MFYTSAFHTYSAYTDIELNLRDWLFRSFFLYLVQWSYWRNLWSLQSGRLLRGPFVILSKRGGKIVKPFKTYEDLLIFLQDEKSDHRKYGCCHTYPNLLPPLNLTVWSGGFLFNSPLWAKYQQAIPASPAVLFYLSPGYGHLFLRSYAHNNRFPSSRILIAAFTSLSIWFPQLQW